MRDYSKLEIKVDSYWANIKRSNLFDFDYMLAKAGKPVDKTEWLMTPQTVNAYYNRLPMRFVFLPGFCSIRFLI